MLGQVSRWFFALLMVAFVASGCSDGGDNAAELQVVAVPPGQPTALPTTAPVDLPTATAVPTVAPTPQPTATADPAPTSEAVPTAVLAAEPALAPTTEPAPALEPTAVPTAQPAPTAVPTAEPAPTAVPAPTAEPTAIVEPTATAVSAGPNAEGGADEQPGAGGPPAEHVVSNVGYGILGQAGGVSISLPAARIEIIGFHEAGHPGAQAFNAAGSGVAMMVMDSRGRGTAASSAADIVIPPGEPVRAPATGTVISANSYILYCEHQDQLVYIEPDGLPGWQVRVFHVTGPLPAVGDRVIAGETVIASGANLLPFESQVDEFTAEPSWAHVHVEVVDTNVPDTRPAGPGCP